VHEHIYAPAGHQTGNRSRGAWRTTSTMGRAQATETIPWKPRHDAEKDKGGKVADRHHVQLPLVKTPILNTKYHNRSKDI
jgi:hypothetical protein